MTKACAPMAVGVMRPAVALTSGRGAQRPKLLVADDGEVAGLGVGAGGWGEPHVGVVVAVLPAEVVAELVGDDARPVADYSPAVGVDPDFVAGGSALGIAEASRVEERRDRPEFDGQTGAVDSELLAAEVRSQEIYTGLDGAH